VALLGLAGAWAGSGQLSCDPAFARLVASRMLMTEYTAVDDDVLDAMAEIANMVVGNVKTVLEHSLGPMGLGIPTVLFGHNLETRSIGSPEWIIVPFTCDDGLLNVQITLAPKRRRIPL
jgi:chemotaxis protein CheX